MPYFRSRNHGKLAMAIAAAVTATIPILAFSTASTARVASGSVVAQMDKPTGQGTLNSIDAANRKVNITHGPVAALKWPGMTMDFIVTPEVDIKALKPGSKIFFTLRRGVGGMYVIDAVKLTQ